MKWYVKNLFFQMYFFLNHKSQHKTVLLQESAGCVYVLHLLIALCCKSIRSWVGLINMATSGLRTSSLAELDGCFVLKSQFSKRCRENRANHCCVRAERTKPSTGSISNQDVCLDITSHCWSIMHETRVRSRILVCKNSSKPRVYRYTKTHTCLHFALKPEI